MQEAGLTGLAIGRLARAVGVGIETIRYHQRRALLPVPNAGGSAFRSYPPELAGRIRFIKRAQKLGFTLDEIATLLQLEDGADRSAIHSIAGERLAQIRSKLADLQKMEQALSHLIYVCADTSNNHPCPIIASLVGVPPA